MTFNEKMKIAAFELSCKSIFQNMEENDPPTLLAWMSETEETDLPSGFKLMPAYEPFTKNSKDIRTIIASTTKILFDILVIGAELIVEEGVSGNLDMEDLQELIEAI